MPPKGRCRAARRGTVCGEVGREAFDERGADVAARHAATGATTARGLSRLVDAGTSKLGITPLDRAVRCGHADVVRLLLRHDASVAAGADVDAANHDGATPLHLCASGFTLFGSQAGKADVARLLLGHGARRDVRNRDGRTALDVAAAEANAAVAALLEGEGVDRGKGRVQRSPDAAPRSTLTDCGEAARSAAKLAPLWGVLREYADMPLLLAAAASPSASGEAGTVCADIVGPLQAQVAAQARQIAALENKLAEGAAHRRALPDWYTYLYEYHVCVDGECVPFDNYACPIVGQYKTTDIMEFPDIGTPMPGPCNGKVCTACEWCHDVSRNEFTEM
ncbi:hypothetical protein EMIHUDRAFT_218961 [Emiliania huxleyi CCMP1516]|uniref:Uncharacterized protein n=2 Tax=Emiliania huxleyi TaxID=2903 RepID=A0A0D3I5H5_EMIH1|nr:hypothetical protein EMIHUDRAFT_218961 [Emiliania huxleyi CCMP1516]EOD06510.1 hypothetical protein EMIHUDRAFT_218961 [Emiliania huxleyi CCMP1516]|eukprot:XP_005758939.1 hypothetical protein EMIHUDRAFT_218961 [Emiliania huxleyi CCMP1516]